MRVQRHYSVAERQRSQVLSKVPGEEEAEHFGR